MTASPCLRVPVLHEDRGHRAATTVELRLDHRADGGPVRVGHRLDVGVGGQEDGLEQFVEAIAGLGADGHERHLTAVLLDDDAALGELGLDTVGLAVGQVHLVEGHDDGHARRLGVVDGLDRLGHDAVVGGHHQHGDVGDLGSARTHGREGLVTGRVEEDDAAAVDDGLAGADVLGDAATLAVGDGGLADGVEQAGLAVVDVAHDGHDRGTLDELVGVGLVEDILVLGRRCLLDLGVLVGDLGGPTLGHLEAQLLGHERRGVAVDGLVDGGEDAAPDQLADDVRRVDADELRQLLDRDLLGDLDGATSGGVGDLDRGLDVVSCACAASGVPAVRGSRCGYEPWVPPVVIAGATWSAMAPKAATSPCSSRVLMSVGSRVRSARWSAERFSAVSQQEPSAQR